MSQIEAKKYQVTVVAGEQIKSDDILSLIHIFLQEPSEGLTGAIVWNLMLDSDLGPVSPSDGSCKTCYGAVDIDNTNYSKIVRNSHYYLIGVTFLIGQIVVVIVMVENINLCSNSGFFEGRAQAGLRCV